MIAIFCNPQVLQKASRLLSFVLFLFCSSLHAQLSGFCAASSAEQLKLEGLFVSVPSRESSRQHHRILTRRPHVAGGETQKEVARYVLQQLESYGITSEIVEYHAYLAYPKVVSVSLLEPEKIDLKLKEESYPEDEDSQSEEVISPFHAYSASGDIVGEVVYVNYGLPEDYTRLEEQGISVQGRIVLARYGRSFRGVKVKVAEEKGATGILIYSDPIDDGYFQGDVFPKGPFRPASAVQRGSVQYLFIYPGDPLTPGRPASKNAQRLDAAAAENLPRILSHPLSYEDASPILRSLGGASVPKGWQGALPFTYHLGPGPARVRIQLEMDYALLPIRNVIGRIAGAAYPDEWVIVGNHMDAWTFGGVDANSGTTVFLEMAAGLGKVLAEGYRPQRTIILAAWDGEEYGLIGSTEWGENLQSELMKKAVAYLNVDIGVSSSHFTAAAVPSLHELVREVTRSIKAPKSGESLYEEWWSQQRGDEETSLEEVLLADLGSGSDYTVFIDYLGIPSLTMGFEGPYGVYHSRYDTHYWMSRFGDPAWRYHPILAEIWGRMALRLANAEVLPFSYADYGRSIAAHLEDQRKRSERIENLNIDWESLLLETLRMERIGEDIGTGTEKLLEKPLQPSKVRRINSLLLQTERAFLLEAGLPRRSWFKHAVYGPGYYTGYECKPLPGLSQAIDDHEYALAEAQATLLLQRLRAVNQILDQIRRLTK